MYLIVLEVVLMQKEPRYMIIKNDLKSKIETGEYQPGAKLPSETELVNIYHVSRITVRSAIDALYQDGLIQKKQGKRSYVKNISQSHDMTMLQSYTEEIIQHGMTPSRKVLTSELRLPTLTEQQTLCIDKISPVFYLERVIYADNQPLCYTKTTLPYFLFQDIENIDFSLCSLYDKIENQYHIKIHSSTLRLKAVGANRQVAQLLDIEKDMPVLLTSAVTYGEINENLLPIEMFSTYYLTDRFEYTMTHQRCIL